MEGGAQQRLGLRKQKGSEDLHSLYLHHRLGLAKKPGLRDLRGAYLALEPNIPQLPTTPRPANITVPLTRKSDLPFPGELTPPDERTIAAGFVAAEGTEKTERTKSLDICQLASFSTKTAQQKSVEASEKAEEAGKSQPGFCEELINFTQTGDPSARGGMSPSSSPRLPSPPPFTEVQIGPKSPTIGDSNNRSQLGDAAKLDDGASRRIRPGTKASEMASGPPLVEISELDSPFQLQEHLKAMYYNFTRDHDTGRTFPITKETALQLAHPPPTHDAGETVDKNLWLYELCRFLTMKANNLITAFFSEKPQCSATTCPEMRASEWQYLCAVHDPPKSCCAIDYCCHTLDWATNILTSPKLFPSRMVLGGDNGNIAAAMRQLTNIFRRVYRIFAHAWFQHREVFWAVEANDGLYIFFKTVCDVYQLIPEDNYTIPNEAEGERDEQEQTPVSVSGPEFDNRVKLMPKDKFHELTHNRNEPEHAEATTTVSVGATTRRHKHTPSTGSQVTTIAEGPEEEDADEPVDHLPDATNHSGHSAQKPLSTEADLANGMGKLDLGNSIPPFDGKYPHDPTPNANHEVNPMDFAMTSTEIVPAASPTKKDEQHIADDDATIEYLETFDNTPAEHGDVDTVIGPGEDKAEPVEENVDDTAAKEDEASGEKEKVEPMEEAEADKATEAPAGVV